MKETNLLPFHLAIPVYDLEKSRDFYKNVLGCEEGRSSDHWVDFNLFGHQLVIHYKEKSIEKIKTNPVDGKDVPIPHFGVILEWNQFAGLLISGFLFKVLVALVDTPFLYLGVYFFRKKFKLFD